MTSHGSAHGAQGDPATGSCDVPPLETGGAVELQPAQVLKKPKIASIEKAERELQKLENEIVSEASELVHSVLRFAEVDPENPEIPGEWLDEISHLEIGTEEHEAAANRLKQRHRVAKAGWLSAKEAPVALAIAKSVMVGAMKARAMAGNAPKTLNITMVSMSAPGQELPAFPEKEIKHE